MSATEVMQYVGVTGLPGSGKGAFVEELGRQLAERSIRLCYWSLSDELREEARRRDLPVTRPILRDIANELRSQYGGGVLAGRVAGKARASLLQKPDLGATVVIVDAIRNPEEVRTLQRELAPTFTLVAVEAPIELLVARITARARADETAEVVAQEFQARQMILGESGRDEPDYGHNIDACMAMADYHLDNSGTLSELVDQTTRFLTSLLERLENGFGENS